MSSSQNLQNNNDGGTRTPNPEVGQNNSNYPITNSRSSSNTAPPISTEHATPTATKTLSTKSSILNSNRLPHLLKETQHGIDTPGSTILEPEHIIIKPRKSNPQEIYSFHRFVIKETNENDTLGINLGYHRTNKIVRISKIHTNSIAEKAGIKVNDVIMHTGSSEGQSIDVFQDVYQQWLEAAKCRPLSICFEVKRREDPQAEYCLHRFIFTTAGNLGITFMVMPDLLVNNEECIARVEKVTPDSMGDDYGVQCSDYVLRAYINDFEIEDFDTLVKQAKNESARPITIEVMRKIESYTNKLKAQEDNDNPYTFSFSSQENVKATSAEEADSGMYHMFAVSNYVMLSLTYFSIIATVFFFL